MGVKIEQHPVYRVPTAEDAEAAAKVLGCSPRDALVKLFERRGQRIANERHNPLVYGWEPPIWRVCDAVLGLDWAIPDVFGKDYGPRMRKVLGLERPATVLLINGGQRGGKTQYMVKRSLMCMLRFNRVNMWAFHTDQRMSVDYQQELFWQHFPPEYRRQIKTETTYILYKKKTGFADSTGFILPNLSACSFRYYGQDRNTIEGGELGAPQVNGDERDEHGRFVNRCLGFMADELIPADWVETLLFRLTTRDACGVIGFTPVEGYTETVKLFLDGGQVARGSTAFLLPKDGLEAEAELALEREDCDGWLKGKGPAAKPGRVFELAPRVVRCATPGRAAVFFHSSDNPYGNPRQVALQAGAKDRRWKLERFYGVAEKQITGKFPLFNPKVHVIEPERIPEDGTNYLIVDPCDGRNFFMLWIRACANGRAYVVQEWPSQVDPVPGFGVLGEWAVPSGDSKKVDGKRGPAQRSLGWGLCQYKAEVARLEGWECYRDEARADDVARWDQYGPARVKVFRRFMDARFANADSLNADGVRTLFEEFDEIGLTFEETSGASRKSVDDGVTLINDALYYNAEQPATEIINEPRLRVSARCLNTIFALQVWTNEDGAASATKDPVDCLRYFYLKDCQFVQEVALPGLGGAGCY